MRRQTRPSGRDADPRRTIPLQSARWQKLRAYVLARDPLCRDCGAIATDLDHHDGNPGNNDCREKYGQDDSPQVHQAGITPDTAIQTEQPERWRVDTQDQRKALDRSAQVRFGKAQIKAEPIGKKPAHRNRNEIVRNGEESLSENRGG